MSRAHIPVDSAEQPTAAHSDERPSKTRLKQASHALQDLGEAAVALPDARLDALPIDESLQALRDFEDAVTAAIGGNGTLVAHESSDGLRTLHFYVDSQTNAEAQIAETLPGWREGRASTQPARDPAFAKVRHLMP